MNVNFDVGNLEICVKSMQNNNFYSRRHIATLLFGTFEMTHKKAPKCLFCFTTKQTNTKQILSVTHKINILLNIYYFFIGHLTDNSILPI